MSTTDLGDEAAAPKGSAVQMHVTARPWRREFGIRENISTRTMELKERHCWCNRDEETPMDSTLNVPLGFQRDILLVACWLYGCLVNMSAESLH